MPALPALPATASWLACVTLGKRNKATPCCRESCWLGESFCVSSPSDIDSMHACHNKLQHWDLRQRFLLVIYPTLQVVGCAGAADAFFVVVVPMGEFLKYKFTTPRTPRFDTMRPCCWLCTIHSCTVDRCQGGLHTMHVTVCMNCIVTITLDLHPFKPCNLCSSIVFVVEPVL